MTTCQPLPQPQPLVTFFKVFELKVHRQKREVKNTIFVGAQMVKEETKSMCQASSLY